jgi:hypothetical protein
MKGLFINNKKAKDSIYESGLMVYNNLKLSQKLHFDYIEIDRENRKIPLGYQFYFFNYHPITMYWMDPDCIKKIPGLKMTMVLEVLPGNPFAMCPKNLFDIYIVLDPTIKLNKKDKVYPFPRPLEKIDVEVEYTEPPVPTIGTFGFATKGKGFQHVVEAVNREFEQAVIRINIPHGSYVPDSEKYADFLGDLCRQKAKPGIDVIITYDYMSKEELVNWCAANTLNCFLYDRNQPGLSATTDQCIIAGRPLSVSGNETFRHITKYLPPYPEWSLKDSIEKSLPYVHQMAQDWSQETFTEKFETLMEQQRQALPILNNLQPDFLLEIKKGTLFSRLERRYKKIGPLFSFLRFIKYKLKRKKVKVNEQMVP